MQRDEAMLRKVGDYVAEHPKLYDQDVYIGFTEAFEERTFVAVSEVEQNICGTTMCIAGTAAFLRPDFVGWQKRDWQGEFAVIQGEKRKVSYDIHRLGQKTLGITKEEANRLFGPEWQPKGTGPLAQRVKDALYKLADGASVEEVSRPLRPW